MTATVATGQTAVSRLAEAILAAGVRPGGVLLVHASLRSLGVVPGGTATVIAGLRQALGPDGTLLMPQALSYAAVTPERPRFDLALTPSNVGMLAETFRRQPGVERSLHPTHSVCGMGRLRQRCSRPRRRSHTLWAAFTFSSVASAAWPDSRCWAVGLRANTSFHAIEEIVTPPYLFGAPLDYELVDGDGQRVVKRYLPHNFEGYRQRYERIAALLYEPALRAGRVLAATVQVLDAAALWEAALGALRRDPLAFVEQIAT